MSYILYIPFWTPMYKSNCLFFLLKSDPKADPCRIWFVQKYRATGPPDPNTVDLSKCCKLSRIQWLCWLCYGSPNEWRSGKWAYSCDYDTMPVTVHNVTTVLRQSFTCLGVENKLETSPVAAGSEDNANQECSHIHINFHNIVFWISNRRQLT